MFLSLVLTLHMKKIDQMEKPDKMGLNTTSIPDQDTCLGQGEDHLSGSYVRRKALLLVEGQIHLNAELNPEAKQQSGYTCNFLF